MSLPTDPGTGIPTLIQDFDGFDVDTVDTSRWNAPVEVGSTLITQATGNLIFTNAGTGTKGISYLESKQKFGKNWRKSVDLKLQTTTGTSGEISLCLYKDANNYVKMGPYKGGAINCNCLLRYKIAGSLEQVVPLTADVINVTDFSTCTFGIIADTILCYYQGILMTSIPFGTMYNFTARIEAGTGANADTLLAKANDYETINNLDTLLITIGAIVKDIHDTMGTSMVTDISGDITLADTTEQFITLTQATYGTKFRVNLFADLEGMNIGNVTLVPNGGAGIDYTELANNLKANSVPLVYTPTAGDCIYFEHQSAFHRIDFYIDQGTSNTDNIFVWEYWNGATWATLAGVTDGTVNNGKVFGKSGSVTFTSTPTAVGGWYWIRARVTTAGTSVPKATHIQVTPDGVAPGFDGLAAFLSSLTVRVYRKRGDGSYALLPADMALPYTQCILSRNVELSNLPAWTDIKIGFKLSATPTTSITIPYTGYVETIEI